MPPPDRPSLWALTIAAATPSGWLADDISRVVLDDLRHGCSLEVPAETLRGRSVLVRARRQLPAVLAAIALDGIARRLLLCPPDVTPAHLPSILADAKVDAVVSDTACTWPDTAPPVPLIACRDAIAPLPGAPPNRSSETEFVLFTSGTAGQPKMVVHSLQSLSGPLDDGLARPGGAVWSTFYDVRRYGGLQILLRALIGGGAMVLSSAEEPVGDFLARAGAAGVTHISGTPSHWRRALMSPSAGRISPSYLRLSGEIADQAILDALHRRYPAASIAHAFASTEAGVAFDVRDGCAGFPAMLLDQPDPSVAMRVEGGTLRIRSARTASRYLGAQASDLCDHDGFVDTGNLVERRGARYYFVGRREGVINVGGLKVCPEEVEAVINQHPQVRMSRAWARRSPITGAIVAADVVVRTDDAAAPFDSIRSAILDTCRRVLPAHKVPATLRQVASLPIDASGKLSRRHA